MKLRIHPQKFKRTLNHYISSILSSVKNQLPSLIITSVRADYKDYEANHDSKEKIISDRIKKQKALSSEYKKKINSLNLRYSSATNKPSEKLSTQELETQREEVTSIGREIKSYQRRVNNVEKFSKRTEELIDQLKTESDIFLALAHRKLSKAARNRFILVTFILVATFVLTADILQYFIPDIGKGVKHDYYSTVAQLLPVMLIALYLSNSKSSDEKKSEVRKWEAAINRVDGIVAFIIGEALSIGALSNESSSTFLFIMVNTATFALGIQLIRAVVNTPSN